MPTLIIEYKSADKTKKGKILDELIALTKMKYPTVRRKILAEKVDQGFSFAEQKLIAEYYKKSIDELFPKQDIPAEESR
jgi:hypothetical protein